MYTYQKPIYLIQDSQHDKDMFELHYIGVLLRCFNTLLRYCQDKNFLLQFLS